MSVEACRSTETYLQVAEGHDSAAPLQSTVFTVMHCQATTTSACEGYESKRERNYVFCAGSTQSSITQENDPLGQHIRQLDVYMSSIQHVHTYLKHSAVDPVGIQPDDMKSVWPITQMPPGCLQA